VVTAMTDPSRPPSVSDHAPGRAQQVDGCLDFNRALRAIKNGKGQPEDYEDAVLAARYVAELRATPPAPLASARRPSR
jgi:hypothetical protein